MRTRGGGALCVMATLTMCLQVHSRAVAKDLNGDALRDALEEQEVLLKELGWPDFITDVEDDTAQKRLGMVTDRIRVLTEKLGCKSVPILTDILYERWEANRYKVSQEKAIDSFIDVLMCPDAKAPLVDVARSHKSPYLRRQALHALVYFPSDKDALAVSIEALEDSGLVSWDWHDGAYRVYQTAETNLHRLTGIKRPKKDIRYRKDRKFIRTFWADWWKTNKDKLVWNKQEKRWEVRK